MVTIIDYGIGNLRSIEKAFQAVGADVIRTDRPEVIVRAERVVLPGVGAFGACADEIRRRGLEEPVREVIAAGKPFMGVCVGMQLLFEESDEMGRHAGLGILPGRIVHFRAAPATHPVDEPQSVSLGDAGAWDHDAARPLKVPHMGWNTIRIERPSALLDGIEQGAFFYFVHSYHARPDEPSDVLASTTYGAEFPAIVHRNNVYGVQFHPEKSQKNGLRLLRNFVQML